MDTKKYYTKQVERAREELEGGEVNFAQYTSRKLMQGEAAVQVAAMHFCEMAGDDRRGELAQTQADCEQALDLIRAGHRILSRVGARRDLIDIPGEGGR